MTCRSGENFHGPWSAPAFFVILVMNEKDAKSVMASKVKLGADASVAAGPVGRTTSAETDIVMNAEMLAWSRAKGVFAGVSLEGSTIRSDGSANKNLYRKEVTAKQIIIQKEEKTPDAGKQLIALPDKTSPKRP